MAVATVSIVICGLCANFVQNPTACVQKGPVYRDMFDHIGSPAVAEYMCQLPMIYMSVQKNANQ